MQILFEKIKDPFSPTCECEGRGRRDGKRRPTQEGVAEGRWPEVPRWPFSWHLLNCASPEFWVSAA